MKVVIVGGGWAGCAAAITASKNGASVVLLERTDMLLGTGLVGGIMRNNGRFTATEEMIAMGGGELFHIIDDNCRHKNIEFPGHCHSSIYNVATIEPAIKKFIQKNRIDLHLKTRMEDVVMEGPVIKSVISRKGKEKISFEGDVFIDATGTAGPPGNCTKYGNGCAMCILRCPSFSGRVSLAYKAGVKEINGKKGNQIGAMSGSCKLFKESLSSDIIKTLDEKGVAIIPIPVSDKKKDLLSIKACQQYALPEFKDNIILIDTGHAKLMSPFFPLEALRIIPGLENVRYEDPYSGDIGNSIRFIDMSPRDDTMKVEGVENLFCGGEKAGLLVGHTEAIVTGTLAGYNAVKYLKKEEFLLIPDSLTTGDAITHVREEMKTEEGLGNKYTFSGSVYFARMKEKGLYTVNIKEIGERVKKSGLTNVFSGHVN